MSETQNRSSKIEEIERQQRLQKQQSSESSAFAQPTIDAMQPREGHTVPPVLTQEQIEESQPHINWTAVICIAMVSAVATVILLIAKPWQQNGQESLPPVVENIDVDEPLPTEPATSYDTAALAEQPQAAEDTSELQTTETIEPKVMQSRETPAASHEEQIGESKMIVKEPQKKLPIVTTTGTATTNGYNGVRLVDLSKRKLTREEVATMNAREKSLARNAVYARHGYQFKNAELKEFFGAQSWFKGTLSDLNSVQFTEIEVFNIKLIQEQEK